MSTDKQEISLDTNNPSLEEQAKQLDETQTNKVSEADNEQNTLSMAVREYNYSADEEDKVGKDLYDWNPETDEKTLLISAEKFIPPGREKPLKLEYQKNLIWSPDEKKLREGLSRGVDLQ